MVLAAATWLTAVLPVPGGAVAASAAAASAAATSAAALSTTTAAPAPSPVSVASVAPSTTDPTAALVPRFDLTSLTPGIAAPGADLTVTGTLHAGPEEPLPADTLVQVRLQRSLLSTRTAVAEWVEPDHAAVGSLLVSQPLGAELPAGAAVPVTITVPAQRLGLSDDPASWGPRGMTVTVRDGAETMFVATTRTHLLWFPPADPADPAVRLPAPTRVSVLVPVTGAPLDVSTGASRLSTLTTLTAPGGRLDAALRAADVPGATLVLDPAVLDASATDGVGPDGSAPTTPPDGTADGTAPEVDDVVEDWRARVRAVAADHEVLMLAHGDPDLAAVAHAGEVEIAQLAEEQGRAGSQLLLGENVRTDIAWVPGGEVDPVILDLLAGLGRRAVVLDGPAEPLLDDRGDTASGRVTIKGGAVPTEGLVADGPLSAALAAADDTSDPSAAVTSVQHLLADTAAVTLERPSTSPHLLVTAPRDWAPTPEVAVAAVGALTGAPWMTAAPLQALLEQEPDDGARAPVDLDEQEQAAELPVDTVSDIGRVLADTQQLAAAMEDPRPTVRRAQRSAVALVSAGWRDDRDRWHEAVDAYRGRLTDLRDAVRVVPGSTVTQVSRNVELPVTVENDLDQPVTVVVDVRPESSRLVVTRRDTVTLPARERTVVYVPVRGVGNGDTSVRVQLFTESGFSLGEPVRTRVLVRADWETQGTFLLAGVAALVLVVGLVRTFRRGPQPRLGHDPLAGGAAAPDGQAR